MALPSGGSIRRGEIHARARARARVCVCRIAFIDLPVAQFEAGDQLEGAEGGRSQGRRRSYRFPHHAVHWLIIVGIP